MKKGKKIIWSKKQGKLLSSKFLSEQGKQPSSTSAPASPLGKFAQDLKKKIRSAVERSRTEEKE